MGERWYVARVHPGSEARVAAKLALPYKTRPAFETYLPWLRTRAGRTPLFPSYLIVAFDFDFDNWQPINGVVGVVKLLPKHLIVPEALPDGFVETFRAREAAGDFDLAGADEIVLPYAKGDEIEVKSGTYQGEFGTFVEQRKSVAHLLMSVLGGRRLVKVPASQVA